jgi:hypothetical protein
VSGVRQRLQNRTAAPGIIPHFGQSKRRAGTFAPQARQAGSRTLTGEPQAGHGLVNSPPFTLQ